MNYCFIKSHTIFLLSIHSDIELYYAISLSILYKKVRGIISAIYDLQNYDSLLNGEDDKLFLGHHKHVMVNLDIHIRPGTSCFHPMFTYLFKT